jgi:hypothetical protein
MLTLLLSEPDWPRNGHVVGALRQYNEDPGGESLLHKLLHWTLADDCMIEDLLLHGASLPDFHRNNEDISPALLPPHFPSAKPPTRHLCHNRTLCFVHRHLRPSDRTAVHSYSYCLGTLGR